MANITAGMVRELRDLTGAAMMDCKKALEEAGGDQNAAVDILRQKGLKSAAKKSSRDTNEGRVAAKVAGDGLSGAIVGVSCETDFVAATPDFQAFLGVLVETAQEKVRGQGPAAAEALMGSAVAGGDELVSVRLTQVVAKLGENMRVSTVARFEVKGGVVSAYVHHNHKIGALVAVSTSAPADKAGELAKKLAQHICAAKPMCLDRGSVPAEEVERERAVHLGSEELASRPAEMREKIVLGKIEKFFQASALIEQPWTFDDKLSVQKALEKELGAGTRIEAFCLVEL